MANSVNFNDYSVDIEIFDSVLGRWVVTDYSELDSEKMNYLRNRELIQPKLVAGGNVTIDPVTNVITAALDTQGIPLLVSKDPENAVELGTDGKLFVNVQGLLEDRGSVPTRSELPLEAPNYDAYMISDEKIIVFAYNTEGILTWLPLNFFVDMNLYPKKTEVTQEIATAVVGITEAKTLDSSFADFDPLKLSGVSGSAVGRNQLLVYFTPLADITAEGSPLKLFSVADQSILPVLPIRFGQVWDQSSYEQVGFCAYSADGSLSVNAVSTLFLGKQYIILV